MKAEPSSGKSRREMSLATELEHQTMAARFEAYMFAGEFKALAIQEPVQPFAFAKHRLVVGALAFHHEVSCRRDDSRTILGQQFLIE